MAGEAKLVGARIRLRSAAVQAALFAALHEWAELPANKENGVTEPQRDWLRAVLAAEPEDAWGEQVRAAGADLAALAKLAASADVAKVPARTLTRLADRLDSGANAGLPHNRAASVALLRRAQAQYPADFWVNYALGIKLLDHGRPPPLDEAVRFLTAAVALRPETPGAQFFLGHALSLKGQADEAIPYLKKAIALDPKNAPAHLVLGAILCDVKRDYDGAIACFRKAIELDPYNHQVGVGTAHTNLGNALSGKGQFDEAIDCYRKAIARNPKDAKAHSNLGATLHRKGQVDEAITCLRKAIEVDPKNALAHFNLGVALDDKGQVEEAIACYKKAIALNPQHAGAHNNVGNALYLTGQVDEAIACFEKAIALDPKLAPARNNLARAERVAAVRDKLPAFQNGSYMPGSNAERLALAEWCQIKKLPHAATRLYAAAFAADPKLADDLGAAHRYNAACYAALAAAGQGEDAAKLDDKERARLRKQALDWLRADLALRTKQLESGQPADRAAVQQALRHWQQDSDLAGIRDAAALAKLPAEERAASERLWANLAALLNKAGAPAGSEGK
jgi:tetratricopeptide (TPR) repeat protein